MNTWAAWAKLKADPHLPELLDGPVGTGTQTLRRGRLTTGQSAAEPDAATGLVRPITPINWVKGPSLYPKALPESRPFGQLTNWSKNRESISKKFLLEESFFKKKKTYSKTQQQTVKRRF